MRPMKSALAASLLLAATALAGPITYTANLSTLGETPPPSGGTGFTTVTIDTVANTLIVNVTFSGLNGLTTASHIHCCLAVPFTGSTGVATTTPTFTGFPLGVTSGTYSHTFDLTLASSYNPAFVALQPGGTVAAAEAALAAGMAAGETYLNIHTTTNPGGEIRGFLQVAIPEPSTFVLAGAALAGLVIRRRRR